MGNGPEGTRLERIAAVLRRHGVEFIVIGGEAAAMGYRRAQSAR